MKTNINQLHKNHHKHTHTNTKHKRTCYLGRSAISWGDRRFCLRDARTRASLHMFGHMFCLRASFWRLIVGVIPTIDSWHNKMRVCMHICLCVCVCVRVHASAAPNTESTDNPESSCGMYYPMKYHLLGTFYMQYC